MYTGVTLVALCLLHGATFLALKTTGELRSRSGGLARRIAPAAALLTGGFAIWTHVSAGKGVLPNPVEVGAVLAVAAAWWLAGGRHVRVPAAAVPGRLPAAAAAQRRAAGERAGARSASPGWRENRAIGWPRAAITRVRRCPRGGPALR
ncbi:MAG: cytochrome d ubiquinol oxidase subunit II [Streptosporangiales bacterium]